jgi:cephalosporin hydroxylase
MPLRKFARAAAVGLVTRSGRSAINRLFYRDLIVRTGNFASISWLGRPIWQNPLDLWTTQETIAEVRPALLIETGTFKGGSALFYAHLMDLLGQGRVVTIDIEDDPQREDHPRITYVKGSSTDPEIFERMRREAEEADGPVMVILDADHSRDHVARELELYGGLVTPGSYLLSQDGIIDKLERFRHSRPGPLDANRAFLEQHPEFEQNSARNERFGITHHPLGWMRRRQ